MSLVESSSSTAFMCLLFSGVTYMWVYAMENQTNMILLRLLFCMLGWID